MWKSSTQMSIQMNIIFGSIYLIQFLLTKSPKFLYAFLADLLSIICSNRR